MKNQLTEQDLNLLSLDELGKQKSDDGARLKPFKVNLQFMDMKRPSQVS
ncbi:hypothetical protein BT93_C1640 [Corymbia citriodora subsp. variegata]|nr:hypothetical protein BT93_C1640 [Corymbia citriodora subsp. variegata]